MAYRALLFGSEKIIKKMKPYYDTAVKRGDFEIVNIITDESKPGGGI